MLASPPSATETARPRQAVILAGGRGTRLAPLTDTMPKPMVPFHGRPFLDYLLELLAGQGFQRALVLTGYLGDQIAGHFGSSAHGLELSYAHSPVEDDTGARLRKAIDRIDDCFLLLYCDNYWPINFDAMWQQFCRQPVDVQITVYANTDGFTRDNLRVQSDGLVDLYDKSRTADGLAGVDIGFAIVRRTVVEQLPEANCSFEQETYPRLAAAGRLGAFVTAHRYYSVGNVERLPVTEAFLARTPAILLDRDGVLNERPSQGTYVTTPADWRWKSDARPALRRLHEAGYRCVVITNQAGIARGMLSEQDLSAIHTRLCLEAEEAGGRIAAIYHCPHHWDDGCACRKPKPGMLLQAQREHHLDLSRTWFIGDDERDGEAAAAAGCLFGMVDDDHDLASWVDRIIAHDENSKPRLMKEAHVA